MFNSRSMVLAAGICIASGSGFAQELASPDELDAESIVAIVNGVEITLGHMQMTYTTLPADVQNLPIERLWEGLIEQAVRQELLTQSDDAVETLRVRLAVENERRARLAAEVIAVVANEAASVAAVEQEYKNTYETGDEILEFQASHILVDTEAEALALTVQLEEGADFAELARKNSTGPSASAGGDLGWFGEGQMVTPFETALLDMERGSFSAPVQTQFGWHVIKLNDTRVKSAPALEDVYDELATVVQERAIANYVETQEKSAFVERLYATDVDPNILKNLDLLNN